MNLNEVMKQQTKKKKGEYKIYMDDVKENKGFENVDLFNKDLDNLVEYEKQSILYGIDPDESGASTDVDRFES